MMNLEQIKTAVNSGQTVCWKNQHYIVVPGKLCWFIKCVPTGHLSPLTRSDGVTLHGQAEDFFIQ
jgi:hypothetical protein